MGQSVIALQGVLAKLLNAQRILFGARVETGDARLVQAEDVERLEPREEWAKPSAISEGSARQEPFCGAAVDHAAEPVPVHHDADAARAVFLRLCHERHVVGAHDPFVLRPAGIVAVGAGSDQHGGGGGAREGARQRGPSRVRRSLNDDQRGELAESG